MKNTGRHWLGYSLVVMTAVTLTACADAPAGPARQAALAAGDAAGTFSRFPDLTGCEQLAAPEGSVLDLRAFAIGVQIYQWTGSTWNFVAPSATLYADEGLHGQVATHFGGPTWESNSGSRVVGTILQRCTPDATAIQWLSLSAVPTGAGIFAQTTFIQRLFTVGGLAPSTPGSTVGEIAKVPYTAQYFFYKVPGAEK